MTEQNKITDILQKHIKEAFLIEKNIRAMKEALLENFINYINEQIAHLNINIEADTDMQNHRYAGFCVRFEKNDRFHLRWEFRRINCLELIYGIKRVSSKVQKDEELYAKIANLFSRIIFNGVKHKNFTNDPWWAISPRANENGMPWGIDENVWAEIAKPETSKFAKKVISIIKTVYENKELLALLK